MTSIKRLSPFNTKLACCLALALASLSGTRTASARGTGGEHGIVEARGPLNKVVVAGPIALHAYSEFSGASLYTAPAVTGTDADCNGSSADLTSVQADRISTFTVAPGRVACLSTKGKGSIELLWHAAGQPAPVALAKAGR
jgi:hypothetical protein